MTSYCAQPIRSRKKHILGHILGGRQAAGVSTGNASREELFLAFTDGESEHARQLGETAGCGVASGAGATPQGVGEVASASLLNKVASVAVAVASASLCTLVRC